MSHKKVLAAAKVAEFGEVVNEGTWLTQEQLNNIEAVLGENETTVANLTSQLNTANESLTTANNTVTEHAATIQSQQETIQKLKDTGAGAMQQATREKDDVGAVKVKAHENPNTGLNKLGRRGSKPQAD